MGERAAASATEVADEVKALVAGYLIEHPQCVLLEGGEVLFDLSEASHTLECNGDRVLLHVWSEQRNQVRRLVSAARRGGTLRLTAQRFGRKEPQSLELVDGKGKRSPGTRDGARERYRRLLERVLRREFGGETLEGLRSTMDLEHSFGPTYARGLLTRGQRAWAVFGVGATESAAAIEGILTIAILWLVRCREQSGGRRVVEGVRLFVPKGFAALTLARVAWMDERIAKYEVYEVDEATEEIRKLDAEDRGNIRTSLLPAPNERALREPEGRFHAAIPRVLDLLPEESGEMSAVQMRNAAHRTHRGGRASGKGYEMRLRSSAELAFLRYGLEFARIRVGFSGASFNRELTVTVGSGLQETALTESNTEEMRARIAELFARRTAMSADGDEATAPDRRDPLFRLQPERWLESLLCADVTVLDSHLQPAPVYVQVGAVAGVQDRGMLDLLAVTNEHRLAVVEVKADEDLQLAMQGLDYWIRVRDHHLANVDAATGLGDLQRHGYFPETRLRPEAPLLYLVAPALRVHPATETILRHFDPRVQWTLVALDERWRVRLRPIWRRQSKRAQAQVETGQQR